MQRTAQDVTPKAHEGTEDTKDCKDPHRGNCTISIVSSEADEERSFEAAASRSPLRLCTSV